MPLSKAGGGYRVGSGAAGDVALARQGAPAAYTAAATLAVSDLTGGLVTYNSAGAANLTLPTVANLETTVVNAQTSDSFEFVVIGLGAGTGTIVTNTGWTLVGSMAVAQNVAARFRACKTGDSAWTLYQVG